MYLETYEEISKVFHVYDTDRSGLLDQQQLSAVLSLSLSLSLSLCLSLSLSLTHTHTHTHAHSRL